MHVDYLHIVYTNLCEILGPSEDRLLRKHLPRVFSLIQKCLDIENNIYCTFDA